MNQPLNPVYRAWSPWAMLIGKHQTFPLSNNLDKSWGWLQNSLSPWLSNILQPGLVSPVSCSPQPSRTCNHPTGISSECGCDSENWYFHKRHPMRQPPSPGQRHQGQESVPSVGEDVRETIFLTFWVNGVPTGTRGGPSQISSANLVVSMINKQSPERGLCLRTAHYVWEQPSLTWPASTY